MKTLELNDDQVKQLYALVRDNNDWASQASQNPHLLGVEVELRKLNKEIEDVEAEALAASEEPRPTSELIRTWPSASKPDKSYELRRGHDGEVYCSCAAWKFSKVRPRVCKHIKAWAGSVVSNGSHLKPEGM